MLGASLCDDIDAAFRAIPGCLPTEAGTQFTTHCLYPSFEPVFAFVVRAASGFVVHDGGGAARSAWQSGRDPKSVDTAITEQARLFRLIIRDGALTAEVEGSEWLPSAIMAVANASAAAARAASEGVQQSTVTENTLRDLIREVLRELVTESVITQSAIADGFDLRGKSGKRHRFDFAVRERAGGLTLIDAVSPHHVSVASRYVAFSDISGANSNLHGRLIVHQKPLDPEDISLLTQFADVVPLASLGVGIRKYVTA